VKEHRDCVSRNDPNPSCFAALSDSLRLMTEVAANWAER